MTLHRNREIACFDPHCASRQSWKAFHVFRKQRRSDDEIEDPIYSDEQAEAALKIRWPLAQTTVWIILDGEHIVASLEATIRRPGTQNFADYAAHIDAWIGVLKSHQRQGLGSLLLQKLAGFMTTHDKQILTMNARTPAGHAFLSNAGAVQKLLNTRNKLEIAKVDWDQMQRWQGAIGENFPEYSWEVHANRVPFERWESLYTPLNALLSQMPSDDLEQAPIRYEETGVRAWYADLDQTGGQHYLVLVKQTDANTSKIVAVCTAYFDARVPNWATQQLTAVDSELRGKGIAKAVKARMIELIQQSQPNVKFIGTYNAKSNLPMIAVNRQMGYELVREIGNYQIKLEALKKHLTKASINFQQS
jgi:GNAT superfamily N-acetyltransferase